MGKHDDARKELRDARKELAKHDGDEDDNYRELNNRVQEAEKQLPWLLR